MLRLFLFRAAAAILILAAAVPALAQGAGKLVRFGNGKAEVMLPAKLAAKQQPDGDLVAFFGAGGTHKLELKLLDYENQPGRADTAEQFVEFYGHQKKLPVHTDGSKAVVMEGADARVEGKPYRIARWQIGFGKTIVVMTLTAPVSTDMDPQLREFLDRDLDDVIKSVRRTQK